MPLSRRRLLTAAALAPLAVPPDAAAAPAVPAIRSRAEWADGRAARGPLAAEDDVRFLLVHHTVTANDYAAEAVPAELRKVYAFHTSAERGWPDIAYNFFVDRFGTLWEGRTGSLTGPVAADATGGSQGFAQLVCFLGDFTHAPPTPDAMDAAARLCAWLADRYAIDLTAPVTFTSRGSNRWKRGAEVTTDPIAGHRDMSLTACPGDALYPLVRTQLSPAALAFQRAAATPTPTPLPTPSPTPASTPADAAAAATGTDPAWIVGGAGAAALAAAGAAWAIRRRSAGEQPDRERQPAAEEGADEPDEEPSDGQ